MHKDKQIKELNLGAKGIVKKKDYSRKERRNWILETHSEEVRLPLRPSNYGLFMVKDMVSMPFKAHFLCQDDLSSSFYLIEVLAIFKSISTSNSEKSLPKFPELKLTSSFFTLCVPWDCSIPCVMGNSVYWLSYNCPSRIFFQVAVVTLGEGLREG